MSGKLRGMVRRGVFLLHLWLGLTVGLWFVLMGMTGSLLVFHHEWQALAQPERQYVAPPVSKSAPLPLSRIMAEVRRQLPGVPEQKLARLEYPEHPGGAYVLQVGDHADVQTVREVTVDPCTGKILRNERLIDQPLGFVVLLHLYLLWGRSGMQWNGIFGLIAGFILLSGLYLWWPVAIKQFPARFQVRRGASYRRLLFDLHNVFGIYALPVLLVSVLTGISIVFREPLQPVVYALTGTTAEAKLLPLKPAPGATPLRLEQLIAIAERTGPDAPLERITYPTTTGKPLIVRKSRGETGFLSRITISIDPYTGNVLRVEDERTTTPGKQVQRVLTRLHFGWWGGTPTKLLYALAGWVPLALYLTGLLKYTSGVRARAENRAGHRAESQFVPSSGKETHESQSLLP